MLQRTDWPPDYATVRRDRAARLRILHQDPIALAGAEKFYAKRGAEGCIAFIEEWCDTFDPRNAGSVDSRGRRKPTTMPFILFPRQREFIEFLYQCYSEDAHGLVEKSRDMGASWLCIAFSVWLFLFVEGATVGWGSRHGAQVDKIGDMSSIFEKLRFTLRTVPRCFWPEGFTEDNMNSMKIYAPNGNSITGECGDDVGRGGRTRIYFKDESAHYEHPEMIEASLGDNTRVQIDISSVNGLGNVFHRKREAGVDWTPGQPVQKTATNVFVMDWSDHPYKTQKWYEERENKAIEEGLLHVFRQEVDRNYAASVEGIIIPAEWVKSAIDAHVKLEFTVVKNDRCYAGLDVADGGGDRNALAVREGPILRHCSMWGERDTGVTTRRAIEGVQPYARKQRRVNMQYDSIGVGAGVKAESNRLVDEDLMPKFVSLVSWNAGSAVLEPDERVVEDDDESPLNKDFYKNLKAQAWWQLRLRFERTHRAVEKNDPHMYDQDDLISLPSDLPLLRSIQKELSQPTAKKDPRMRLMIDKAPEGTKSPNLADAIVMCFWPVDSTAYDDTMEWV
jgi:phage terminase large subunit